MFHQLQELGSCIELWEHVARMHKISYTCKVSLEALIYPHCYLLLFLLLVLKGSLGAVVKHLPCVIMRSWLMGSSPGNNLLQKCRERLRT
jgi:hypothetical protein